MLCQKVSYDVTATMLIVEDIFFFAVCMFECSVNFFDLNMHSRGDPN